MGENWKTGDSAILKISSFMPQTASLFCFIFWYNPPAEFFTSQFSVIIFGGAFEK